MNNKKKKSIAFILLFVSLVIIALFFGGGYLYHFWEDLIVEIIILLIVSFILMIVPFIFKQLNKKRLEYKKGKKICLLNSIVIFVLFSIPNVITTIENKAVDISYTIDGVAFSKLLILIYFILAVTYYFINMLFFVDNKK